MTIKEARKNSASFMYLWASDEFLSAIPSKYARIIRTKRANQNRLITASFGTGKDRDAKVQEIREQFINDYGMTPAEALFVLAQGGSVAGKNWAEGVYGIGALLSEFYVTEIDGEKLRVNKKNGHIYLGNEDVTDEEKTVYKMIDGKTVPFQVFSKDGMLGEYIFMSQYDKKAKGYGAKSYADENFTYDAKTGEEVSASDSADLWGNINLTLNKVLDWILKLLGVDKNKTQTITASNTLPSQKEDGFLSGRIISEASVILLALAAGGAYLAGGFRGLTSSKKSK